MIKELYTEAGKIESAEHLAKEAGKLGTLRGGTTGAVLDNGEVVGQCHRKALIRFLGLQKSAGGNLWFDMGFANEELWLAKLKKSWPGKIRCEEDYPIEWEVDGTKVTGRPDMVLFDEADNPVAGIELKSVGAINTAVGIRFENKPKLANLLQAAHYSSQVGVPFYLVYTAFISGPLPYWAQKQYGEKKIDPFMAEFKVYIDESGTICYDTEKGKTVKTMISMSNVIDFYRLVADMPRQKNLYSRFKDMDINGKSLPYNVCDYCPYFRVCTNHEGNYDDWIDHVKLLKGVDE